MMIEQQFVLSECLKMMRTYCTRCAEGMPLKYEDQHGVWWHEGPRGLKECNATGFVSLYKKVEKL